jgi:hypothetical protein
MTDETFETASYYSNLKVYQEKQMSSIIKIFNRIKFILLIGIIMANTFYAQSEIKKSDTNFKRDFFNQVEPIKLIDPMAYMLGAANAEEVYVYNYTDIIKYSGHSCAAVAGAYKMTLLALKELYKDKTPERGAIKVIVKGAPDDNVNGPISQVISFITGAADNTGFKGMKGKFSRYNFLEYDLNNKPAEDVLAEVIFERIDTKEKVCVSYNASLIPTNPEMTKLTPLIISGKASTEEIIKFGDLWQERVRIVLLETPPDAFIIKKIE